MASVSEITLQQLYMLLMSVCQINSNQIANRVYLIENLRSGNPIDYNQYGSHSVIVDTRYYKVQENGRHTYVSWEDSDSSSLYTSFSHGVYLRNAHGMDVLMRPESITWRTLGGSIDLYFYAGPSPTEVIEQYQKSTTGLPAMQQYFTFGFHQCRWGYQNWTVLQDIIDTFRRFDIPLETVWLGKEINMDNMGLILIRDRHRLYVPLSRLY